MATIEEARQALQCRCDDYLSRDPHALRQFPYRRLDDAIVNTGRNIHGIEVGFKEVKGEGTKEICVRFHVVQKLPQGLIPPRNLIPSEIEGVPTDVLESAPMRPLKPQSAASTTTCPAARGRQRPVMAGISASHQDVTGGAIGFFARSTRDGDDTEQVYAVSNNHTFADLNRAFDGDPINQPSMGDQPDSVFANLARYAPLRFGIGQSNLVDAAMAKLRDGIEFHPDVMGIGTVTGIKEASIELPVRKFGPQTCLRFGKIAAVHHVGRVDYENNLFANFRNQILIESADGRPFAAHGDSGALIFHRNSRKVVGLLHAVSGSTKWLANLIDDVLSELEIEIV